MDMRWPLAISRAREARGLTQRDVGQRMRLSYVAVGQRERGVTRITEDWLDKFLTCIEMDRSEFERHVTSVKPQSLLVSQEIPLYPNLAAAGRRFFVPEDTGEFVGEFIPRGRSTQHPQAFACKVEGDSMTPEIRPNDIVVCEPVDDEFGEIEDGKVVVVWGGCVETGDVQLQEEPPKRAKPLIVPSGGMIGQWVWASGGGAELRKFNPRYPAIPIPAQHDGRICVAIVVETRRKM